MFYAELLRRLSAGERLIWVLVTATRGSSPREPGAAMAVSAHDSWGTVGGGHLEWKAIEQARAMLAASARFATMRHYPLGPALGQCCGGTMQLAFIPVGEQDRAEVATLAALEAGTQAARYQLVRPLEQGKPFAFELCFEPWWIAVLGAGHVGCALVSQLSSLPCRVLWFDDRAERFPVSLPATVQALPIEDPQAAVAALPVGAWALVLTHSHALDFELCLALAARSDLAYCGLIGSASKAARFRHRLSLRLSEAAAARIHCPIGDPTITSKHPGLIAAGIVTDLARRWSLANCTAMTASSPLPA